MDQQRGTLLSRLLKNDWVITLTATLVGVFVALYLNDWSNNKALRDNSQLAKENILSEIANNETYLVESLATHEKLREIYKFLSRHMQEDGSLLATPTSIFQFSKQHPGVVLLSDSSAVDAKQFRYNGEISLDLNLTQLNLKTIAWRTFQNTKVSTLYDFDCLMYLETVYNITKDVQEESKVLLDYLFGDKPIGDKNRNLLRHLDLLIDYEQIGVETFAKRNEHLDRCG